MCVPSRDTSDCDVRCRCHRGVTFGGDSCPEWSVGHVVALYVNLMALRIPTSKLVLGWHMVNISVGQPDQCVRWWPSKEWQLWSISESWQLRNGLCTSVAICLSQRLSNECLSMSFYTRCEWLKRSLSFFHWLRVLSKRCLNSLRFVCFRRKGLRFMFLFS